VRARSVGDPAALFIAVSDTGPGVAPEIRGRLFEPFVSGRSDGLDSVSPWRAKSSWRIGGLRCVPQPSGACFELQIPWHVS
jgi:hypothetical protein